MAFLRLNKIFLYLIAFALFGLVAQVVAFFWFKLWMDFEFIGGPEFPLERSHLDGEAAYDAMFDNMFYMSWILLALSFIYIRLIKFFREESAKYRIELLNFCVFSCLVPWKTLVF